MQKNIQIENISYRIDEVKKAVFCLNFAFCFMIILYGPLEVFLTNSVEFWFDITHLLPVVLVCFAIMLFALLGINYILEKTLQNTSIYLYIYTIQLILFLGFYIQGNYIPRNYGVLNGSHIEWESYTGYAVASVVLWVFMVAIGIILCIKIRTNIFKIGIYAGVIVVIMLIAALISLLPKTDQLVKKNSIVVTDKDEFVLSENKNIYVLCLDTFDANYLRALLEEDEELYSDMLEDFTFYTNTTGGYPTTGGSIPLLLTQQWNENKIPGVKYLDDAYKKSTLYDTLSKHGYSIGVYTDPTVLGTNVDFYSNIFSSNYLIADYKEFVQCLYKLVFFEYMPHQFKKFFLVNTSDFQELRKLSDDSIIPEDVSSYSKGDESFYKILKTNGFEIDSKEKNAFRFVHLYGMHPPYVFGENVIVDGEQHTYMEAAKGNMNEIRELISQLKAKGVYDNTVIMIIADHGGGELGSIMGCNPLLLIKNFNESHPFKISHAAVSWDDFVPTIETLATEQDGENAVWNIVNEDRERRFLYFDPSDGLDANYYPIMTEYSIQGDISESSVNILPTGRQFAPGGNSKEENREGYILPGFDETEFEDINLPVSRKGNFQDACIRGVGDIKEHSNGTKYAWSDGYYTHFRFKTQGTHVVPYKFILHFDEIYNPENFDVLGTSDMSVYAKVNGKRVEDIVFGEDALSFTISLEALQEETVDIMIFYPYVAAREENEKKNALAITGIDLKSGWSWMEKLTDTMVIDFSENGNFADQVRTGWYSQESTGIWSAENATITFLSDDLKDILMKMNYICFTDSMSPDIYINGKFLCTLTEENRNDILIPKSYLNSGVQTIEFKVKGAISPKELEMNDDGRVFGIFVNDITLTR